MRMINFIIIALIFATSIKSQSLILKDSTNQYDYVIITQDNFIETCNSFKIHKETVRNFSVLVTTISEITSEFSSSETTQENIRDFISFAGNKWNTPKVKYFLLAGNINKIPNFKFESIPNYTYSDTSYSDYYYGIDKASTDTTNLNYSVGRISTNKIEELQNYFNKVIDYENKENLEPWQNNSLFLADDGITPDADYGNIFENLVTDVSNNTSSFISNKFIFQSDTSEHFGTTDSIISFINEIGTSSILFCGHGNSETFTHENLFDINDVDLLTNKTKSFFASFIFSQKFSSDTSTCILDQMLFSENGALSGMAFSGLSFAIQSTTFNKEIWGKLYTGQSLGEVFAEVINQQFSSEKRKINFFGDPSIVLKYNTLASIQNSDILVSKFTLEQNYPNPFNPTTKIKYSVPSTNSTLNITLKVYDILGNQIATLVNDEKSEGIYEIQFNASSLVSGVYYYQLRSGDFVQTRKMLLLK